ncbi:membrane protein [Stenoxybacter acetivorans]|uniref:DUF3108 domain-containing protein n=1 Tax=Stenoxybacter acetivorans TaxID=422441 RepID=UPI000560C63F|nr:membrane protein [Stenoxybacter acetivorans]
MTTTLQKIIALSAIFMALLLNLSAVQAADFPQQVQLQYIGPYGVPAAMTFSQSNNRYRVTADINVPMYQMRFQSQGTVSGNTLNPAVYTDTRKGKLYAQAKFGGGKVVYGKTGEEMKTAEINGAVFDLFTLAWQLAMNEGQLPNQLRITNGKKLYTVGALKRIGTTQMRINGNDTEVNQYRVTRGNDVIDYAFSPQWANIPAKITYTDDGKTYTLKLKSVKLNGKAIPPK